MPPAHRDGHVAWLRIATAASGGGPVASALRSCRMGAAWMEIDLGIVEANTRAVKAAIAPQRLLASLKADAYGHGLVPVAQAVVRGGADMLAVVAVDDALRLRDAGIDARILVYSGEAIDAGRCRAAHERSLVLTVVDGESLAVVQRCGLALQVAIEVETGFDRLGCAPADLPAIVARIDACASLSLAGVYTHLGAYGDGDTSRAFDEQFERFVAVLDTLGARAGELDLVAAASSPVVQWTDRMDLGWVDVGRLLVGIHAGSPLARDEARVCVEPALRRIVTRLGQVRGSRPHRVGVIPLGRASGLPQLGTTTVRLPGGRATVLTIDLEHARVDLGDLDASYGDPVVVHDATDGSDAGGLGIAWKLPMLERRYVGA
jgi:alanine racemase